MWFLDDLEMIATFKTKVETRDGEDYLKIKKVLLEISAKRLLYIFLKKILY